MRSSDMVMISSHLLLVPPTHVVESQLVREPTSYSWVALPDPMGRARSNASSDTGTVQ